MSEPEPMPYAHTGRNDWEWTNKAFDLLSQDLLSVRVTGNGEDAEIRATGACPRCAHDVSFNHAKKIVAPSHGLVLGIGRSLSRPAQPPVHVSVVVACACSGQDHPGRPETIPFGCGIVFSVDVLVQL